ncbi:MAG: hypothetical protein NVS2B7_07330 [Herpetosiphon sp.]
MKSDFKRIGGLIVLAIVLGLTVMVLPPATMRPPTAVEKASRGGQALSHGASRLLPDSVHQLNVAQKPALPIQQANGANTLLRQADESEGSDVQAGTNPDMEFTPGEADDPGERTRWFIEQRAYPKKSIPLAVHRTAVRNELVQHPATGLAPQDTPQWSNLGPAPLKNITYGGDTRQDTSGRALSVAIHPTNPNSILLGTAQGGIWKSTDGAASFHSVGEAALPSLAIDVVRFAPSDPQIVYAGTGEPNGSTGFFGMGVVKSTDGGETWQALPRTGAAWNFEYAYASGLEVDPANPNIVYLTTAVVKAANDIFIGPTIPVTGIFKSTDGGTSWSLLKAANVYADPYGGDSRGFMSLKLVDSNVLYATEHGGGIYKTTNAGASWTLLTPMSSSGAGRFPAAVPDFSYFQNGAFRLLKRLSLEATFTDGVSWPDFTRIDLGMSKANPLIIYAAYAVDLMILAPDIQTRVGLVFKSSDGGGTWTWLGDWPRQSTPDYCRNQCSYDNLIEVNPTNANDVIIGGSANYERLWPDPLNAPTRLLQLPWRGMIYRSTDGGTKWNDLTPQCTQIGTAPVGKDRSTGLDIYPCTALDATLVIHPDQHAAAFDPQGSIYIANDGGLYRLGDGPVQPPSPGGLHRFLPFVTRGAAGAGMAGVAQSFEPAAMTHWQNLNNGLNTLQFYDFDAHPTDPNIILGGLQDNSNGYFNGTFWDGWGYGDGTLGLFDPKDPQHLFIGTQNNVHRHDAGGNKELDKTTGWKESIFSARVIDRGERVPFVPVFTIDAGQPTKVYAVSDKGLYKSTDRGDTFVALGRKLDPAAKGRPSALSVSPKDTNTVYLGTEFGNVFRWNSATGASTLTGTLPPRHVTRILASPIDANTVVVTLSGYNANTPTTPGKVFRSTDRGQSWTDISGDLPDVPISALALDPQNANRMWVGSDVGVFGTTDGGTTWASYRLNMPLVVVTDLKYNATTGFLMAATHGRGMWRITPSSTNPPPPAATPTPIGSQPTPTATVGGSTPVPTRTPTSVPMPSPTPMLAPTSTPTTGTGGTTVQNPGFENATLAPWIPFGSVQLVINEKHTGAKSIHLGGALGTRDGVYQPITISANATSVRVGFWAKTLTVDAYGLDDLCAYLGDPSIRFSVAGGCIKFTAVGNKTWTQYYYDFTAAEVMAVRGQTLSFVIDLDTNYLGPSEAWVDDVFLTVQPGAVPPTTADATTLLNMVPRASGEKTP